MLSTPQNRLKKRLKNVVKMLLVLYVMIGASLYFLQEKLLFLPTELPQDYKYEFAYPHEEVFLTPEEDVSKPKIQKELFSIFMEMLEI
jgi:cytochrome c-type biogenesis protein CcmE